MKIKIGKVLPALVFMGLAVSNAEAAPVAIAEAVMDWSKFSVTAYDSASLVWNSQTAYVSASADGDYQSNSLGNWGSISVTAGNAATKAQSETSATGNLRSYAMDANTSESSTANANSYFQGDFTVAGDGIIVFKVPYTLSATLNPGDSSYNYANAGVSFYINEYSDATSSGSVSANKYVYLYDWNAGLNSPVNKSGVMSLAIVVNGGDNFSFNAQTYAYAKVNSAPVPVPAAAWLLGSGLLGLVGVSRRRQQA